MKKKKFLVLILGIITVFFFLKMIRNFTVEQEIQTLKSEHFIVSYSGIYKSDAEKISKNLEYNYSKIRTNLKDVKHELIKVFVYGSHQKFSLATGLSGNINGTSRGPNEFHFVWTNWFNSVFPDNPLKTAVHEFTHCIQLNILIDKAKETIITQDRLTFDREFDKKFAAEYPRWLWESISIFEAKEINSLSVKYAKSKKTNSGRAKSQQSNLQYWLHDNRISYPKMGKRYTAKIDCFIWQY